MADHEHSTIKHQDHVLLDQPLLRLPYELLRNNFRAAHFTVEKESTSIKSLLKETATASVNGRAPPDHILKNLDAMIAKMRGVKRKLAAYADEESRLQAQTRARAAHLAELYAMHSYDDVKYETWSRKRLDRLLVDYLLRHGYNESARSLTAEKGMDDLVDVQTFTHMSRIQESLRGGSVVDALAWCQDNKKELRKMDSNLEFMLRFQQYIELVRTQSQPRLLEAIAHAKRHLVPYRTTYPDELRKAFGLLAYPPDAAADTYADLYSSERWFTLADLFTSTHNQLLSLPSQPLLHIALSSGLSALKTPACHSSASLSAAAAAPASSLSPTDAAHYHPGHLPVHHATDSAAVSPTSGDDDEEDEEDEEGEDDDEDDDDGDESPRHAHPAHSSPRVGDGGARSTPRSRAQARARTHAQTRPAMVASPAAACPICSTELNELARNVPYAHHTKSHVDPDLLLLPSGAAFGRDRLEDYARKSGLNPAEKVRDLRTGETYPVDELKKVYIT